MRAKRRQRIPHLAFTGILLAPSIAAGADWEFDAQLGGAYNFPSEVTLRQTNAAILTVDADFASEAFVWPIYYSLRVRRFVLASAWEAEFIHHKIYMRNTDSSVSRFSVSHGFNMVMVNRAWQIANYELRAGLGGVLAHPESTVRNQAFAENGGLFGLGYRWTGPAAQLAAGYRHGLTRDLSFLAEVKFTSAYARVGIAQGEATFWHNAVHGLTGLSYRF
jgi:hypothetical protein